MPAEGRTSAYVGSPAPVHSPAERDGLMKPTRSRVVVDCSTTAPHRRQGLSPGTRSAGHVVVAQGSPWASKDELALAVQSAFADYTAPNVARRQNSGNCSRLPFPIYQMRRTLPRYLHLESDPVRRSGSLVEEATPGLRGSWSWKPSRRTGSYCSQPAYSSDCGPARVVCHGYSSSSPS
jgi:hypothetical protein